MRATAQRPTEIPAAALPTLLRALGFGLLTGAIIGLVAALISVPLRRLAGVTDRALLNGLSIAGFALILWLVGGLVYGLAAWRGGRPTAWLLGAMAVVAASFSSVFAGPLSDFTMHLPACAIPLTLIITLGGAAVFLALLRVRLPLGLAAPVATVAALAGASLVYANDTRPAIHYTLGSISAAAPRSAATTSAAVPVASAAPAVTAAAAAPPAQQTPGSGGAVPPTATPATAAPPPAASAPLHFTVSNQSEAAFTVREKLTRLPAPGDAIGKTNAITGDLYLLTTGLAPGPPSVFTVDLRTLTSDAPPRDRYIKQNSLQTDKFPNATFTLTGIDGFPTTYKEGDHVKLTLTGAFNVHGVDQPMTWTGEAQMAGGKLEAVASTDFDMKDFNITPPSVPVVQSVESKVHLDLHLIATQQGS